MVNSLCAAQNHKAGGKLCGYITAVCCVFIRPPMFRFSRLTVFNNCHVVTCRLSNLTFLTN